MQNIKIKFRLNIVVIHRLWILKLGNMQEFQR